LSKNDYGGRKAEHKEKMHKTIFKLLKLREKTQIYLQKLNNVLIFINLTLFKALNNNSKRKNLQLTLNNIFSSPDRIVLIAVRNVLSFLFKNI